MDHATPKPPTRLAAAIARLATETNSSQTADAPFNSSI
jgi:hypothetical protein